MYKKILVPLDGSEFAENALQHARTIAKGCAVDKVVLLRVVAPIIKDVKDMIERSTCGRPSGNARPTLRNT